MVRSTRHFEGKMILHYLRTIIMEHRRAYQPYLLSCELIPRYGFLLEYLSKMYHLTFSTCGNLIADRGQWKRFFYHNTKYTDDVVSGLISS